MPMKEAEDRWLRSAIRERGALFVKHNACLQKESAQTRAERAPLQMVSSDLFEAGEHKMGLPSPSYIYYLTLAPDTQIPSPVIKVQGGGTSWVGQPRGGRLRLGWKGLGEPASVK